MGCGSMLLGELSNTTGSPCVTSMFVGLNCQRPCRGSKPSSGLSASLSLIVTAMAAYTRSILEPLVAALERSEACTRELTAENAELRAGLTAQQPHEPVPDASGSTPGPAPSTGPSAFLSPSDRQRRQHRGGSAGDSGWRPAVYLWWLARRVARYRGHLHRRIRTFVTVLDSTSGFGTDTLRGSD